MLPDDPFNKPLPFIRALFFTFWLMAACTRSGPTSSVVHPPEPGSVQVPLRTYVYECNDGYAFVARVQSEKAWLFLPERTLSLPQVPAASGAKFSDGWLTYWSRAEEASLAAGAGSPRLCRNNPAMAIWEDAKLRGADFRAVGNEPGWYLEIIGGVGIVFIGDYGQSRYEFAASEPLTDQLAGETTYSMKNAEHALKVVLKAAPCRDSMSGESFETTVTVTLDGNGYRGCGRPLH